MGEWNVRYLGSRSRAADTRTFAFERPPDLEYEPGQFFFVLLQGAEDGRLPPMEHHFSFSSSPTEPNVEFTTRMTGHEFKQRLDALSVGEMVHLAGPDGAFTLRPYMRRVAFACAGIGITPARSVVKWALDTDADLDVVVLYGNRNLEEAAFHDEFDRIDSPKVRVVHVLSHPEARWTGRTGHIDATAVEGEIPDWREREFYVSGPPQVVDSIVRVLLDDVGVTPDRLISEHFPGYGEDRL